MLQSQVQRRVGLRAGGVAPRRGVSRSPAVAVQAAKTQGAPRVAVVGITGAVGQEFLTVREHEQPPHYITACTVILQAHEGCSIA